MSLECGAEDCPCCGTGLVTDDAGDLSVCDCPWGTDRLVREREERGA